MNPLQYMLHASTINSADRGTSTKKKYRKKPIKNCLHCGKEHRHNNSFCSADCCHKYKQG